MARAIATTQPPGLNFAPQANLRCARTSRQEVEPIWFLGPYFSCRTTFSQVSCHCGGKWGSLKSPTAKIKIQIERERDSSQSACFPRAHPRLPFQSGTCKRGRQKGVSLICSENKLEQIGTNRKKSEQIGTVRGIPEYKVRKSEQIGRKRGNRNKSG